MTPARRARVLVAGGIALVLLLVAVFRGLLLEQFVVSVLSPRLGLRTQVAQVGGSILTRIDLQGVQASGVPGAGPRAAFAARRLSARYELAALLRGTAAFLDSLEVTLEGAQLDLDLSGPAAGSPAGQQQSGAAPLPRLPQLTVRDSRVLVHGPGFTLEADGVHGTLARADQTQEQAVALRVERFSLRHPALREGTLSVAIAGRYAPRSLAITAAEVNGAPLVQRARLGLGARPGDADLQLALDLWQGSIEIGLQRGAAGTAVRWDVRGVDLQPQQILVNPALGALRGELSTSGNLHLDNGGAATLAGTFSLDWKGARLAGRAVDHLLIRGAAAAGVVRLDSAEGRVGSNELKLSQVTLPSAPLLQGRWRTLLAAAAGSFTASLGDVPSFLAFWGVDTGANAVAVPAHRLRVAGSLEKGTIRLAQCDLAAGLGKAALAGGAVTFPREDQAWGETGFSGSATIDIPRLQDLSALVPLPALAGSLQGTISGTGTFARPEGQVSLAGRGVRIAGKILGDVELQARGRQGSIEIDTLRVHQGGSTFFARGVRFSPAALAASDRGALLDSLAGSFSLRSTDVPALAALVGLPPGKVARTPASHVLTVAGTLRDRAVAVTAGSFAAAGGTITLRAARIALPGRGGDWGRDTTLAGELEVAIPDLERIAPIFRLPPLQGTLSGWVKVSGSAIALGGSVEAASRGLTVDGHRVGDVVVKAVAQGGRVRIETLEVARGGDRLRGRGSYDLGQQTLLEGEADVTVADVAPYLAEFVRAGLPVSGRFHGSVRAAGPVPGTPLGIAAEFSAGRIGRIQGVRGVAQAQYDPGRLRINAFEITGSGGLSAKGTGEVPVDFAAGELLGAGPLAVTAQASIPALEELAFLFPPAYAPTGALTADLVVAGTGRHPEARLEIRGERLQLPPGVRFAPPGPATLAGTLTWGKAEATVDNLRLASPALTFSLSGAWSSPPPLASLFNANAGGLTGVLALRTTFSSPDLAWLQKSVTGLRGLRGSVAGEIAIDGPAGDPLLSGEIRVADGAFRYQNLQPIDALVARFSLLRRSVTLTTFGGNLGGSPFTLSGSVDFEHLGDPVLDLHLLGTNALLYRDEGLRVRADSDLTLRGPLSALSLAGELALTNSLYQKDISVASLFTGREKGARRSSSGLSGISFPEPPLRNMRFDVRLTAREPLLIQTTVLRGAARPDMRLTGTGLLPILRGPILFDTARVLLPSGALEIERGTVLFRESNPDRPALDFGGRMQSLGYDITAQVGGTLDNPEIILSSIPPLPKEELLLFVLTGAPPGSGDGGSFTSMASPMAVYLGKNVVGQLLGGTSRSGKTGFQDRIELQIGKEMTRNGSMTIDAGLLLQKHPLGRGSTLYLTSEKDIYDQYNAGMKILFKFK